MENIFVNNCSGDSITVKSSNVDVKKCPRDQHFDDATIATNCWHEKGPTRRHATDDSAMLYLEPVADAMQIDPTQIDPMDPAKYPVPVDDAIQIDPPHSTIYPVPVPYATPIDPPHPTLSEEGEPESFLSTVKGSVIDLTGSGLMRNHSKYKLLIRPFESLREVVKKAVKDHWQDPALSPFCKETEENYWLFVRRLVSITKHIDEFEKQSGRLSIVPMTSLGLLLRHYIIIAPDEQSFIQKARNIKKLLIELKRPEKNIHLLLYSSGINEIMEKISQLFSRPGEFQEHWNRTELTIYSLAHGNKTSFGSHDNPRIKRNLFLQLLDGRCTAACARPCNVVMADCYGDYYEGEKFHNIIVRSLATREEGLTVSFDGHHIDLEFDILKTEQEILLRFSNEAAAGIPETSCSSCVEALQDNDITYTDKI